MHLTEDSWHTLLTLKSITFDQWNNIWAVMDFLKKSQAVVSYSLYKECCYWLLNKLQKKLDLFRFIKEYRICDQGFSQHLSQYLSDTFECITIPLGYRYRKKIWFFNWLFAADLFCLWQDSQLWLEYVICLYRLEYGDVMMLVDVWEKYQHLYQKIQQLVNNLVSKSWVWHQALRQSMSAITMLMVSEDARIKKAMKERLSLKNSLVLAKLLMHPACYSGLLIKLFQKKEIKAFVSTLQLHYPRWLVLYKVRSKLALSISEKVVWENFSVVYYMQCLKDAKGSGCVYGQLIQRISEQSDQAIEGIIETFFLTVVEKYPYFWQQAMTFFSNLKRHTVSGLLKKRLDNWYYTKKQLSQLSFESVNLYRVKKDSHWLYIREYKKSLDKKIIHHYLRCLLDVNYQYYTELPFIQVKEAQILWMSVYLMLCPKVSDCYFSTVVNVLEHQKSLPGLVSEELKAYMVTIGLYTFPVIKDKKLYQIFPKTKDIESPVWKKGMQLLQERLTKEEK